MIPTNFKYQKRKKKIRTFQEYFTDEIAKSYSNREDVLFISDIRRVGFGKNAEKYIIGDMKMQMDWCQIMKPKASMLKFRLPYSAGETEYLSGDVRLQTRGPLTTTETRLISTDFTKMTKYNNTEYEEKMFYINTILREWQYYSYDGKEPTNDKCKSNSKSEGLDHCFDCALEYLIWKDYIDKFKSTKTPEDYIEETSKILHQYLSQPPHGICPRTEMRYKRPMLIKEHEEAYKNRVAKKIERSSRNH